MITLEQLQEVRAKVGARPPGWAGSCSTPAGERRQL
jgi:hypothetical protein